MKILFNGDSNMAGEELQDISKSMAGIIADYLKADYDNLAVTGSGNDRIYNSTLKYLEENTNADLVVIGWTEHAREQWYFDGQFHEINRLNLGRPLPENLKRRYEFWKTHIKHDGDWFRIMGMYWHNKIFNLHTMLKEKKNTALFFQCFCCFSSWRRRTT